MSYKSNYVHLKDVCTVNQGLQIPISERFTTEGENRYFYITVQFLKDSFKNKFYVENPPISSICNKDDIIVVRTGSTGQVITGIEGCFHNNFFKVNYDKEKIVGKYLYYCLHTTEKQKEMAKRAGITTIPDLNHFMFLDMKIPLLSKTDQLNMVKVLDALNSKIELNNKINAELEAMAKTLYDYWFVQFDFPNADGKPYKSSGGEMVNVKEGKGDRAIPAGWEVKKLGKVLKTALGGTPSTKEPKYWLNGDIPWLNSGEISNFPIISSEKCVTQAGIDSSAASLLPKGSVVVSIVRYIRPSILAIDACANQSVLGIYESDKLLNSFIYPYLVSQVPRLMSLRTGAQQPHINKETIDTSLIVIPKNNVLLSYYKIANPLFKEIMNIAFQNQQLTQLRDWLLPMLMNGQVSIK
jgi:type I restriction enzyme S subunit